MSLRPGILMHFNNLINIKVVTETRKGVEVKDYKLLTLTYVSREPRPPHTLRNFLFFQSDA